MEEVEKFLSVNYGNGSGYGSGYGYNSDSGNGSGYGDGSGDGFGLQSINGDKIFMVDELPMIFYSIHNNYAKVGIVNGDLSICPCYLAKVGDFFAHGKTLKKARCSAQQKYEENRPLEERILSFKDTFPSLRTKAKGKDFYDWHHILTGSCVFGRDCFCEDKGIDLEKEYSVDYFLEITKDSYGSNAIKRTREAYK